MSKIKKGLKKVFKGVKKVAKKIWKPVLIAGAVLLTGGLAAGGFAAFSGVSGVGGFMGAVGKTMAIGAKAIAGSLGMQTGWTLAGNTAANAAASTMVGTSLKAASGTLGGSLVGAGATSAAATSGIMGTVGAALKGLTGSTVGQLAIAQGIMGGLQSVAQSRETARQEKRYDTEYVWGVQRRGGDGTSVLPDNLLPDLLPQQGPNRPPTPVEWFSGQPQYASRSTDYAPSEAARAAMATEGKKSSDQQSPENMAFRRSLIRDNPNVPGLDEDDSWFMPMNVQQPGLLWG